MKTETKSQEKRFPALLWIIGAYVSLALMGGLAGGLIWLLAAKPEFLICFFVALPFAAVIGSGVGLMGKATGPQSRAVRILALATVLRLIAAVSAVGLAVLCLRALAGDYLFLLVVPGVLLSGYLIAMLPDFVTRRQL